MFDGSYTSKKSKNFRKDNILSRFVEICKGLNTLLLFSGITLLFGCIHLSTKDNISLNIDSRTKSVDDAQKVIISKLTALEKKLSTIEKNMSDLKKPSANPSDNKPKADPNKVYDIADAGSAMLGSPDAKVTIVKWIDFQ